MKLTNQLVVSFFDLLGSGIEADHAFSYSALLNPRQLPFTAPPQKEFTTLSV